MLVCETFAGMLVSWFLMFASLTFGLFRSFDGKVELVVLVGYCEICFMTNFLIIKDMMIDFKQNVS